MDERIESIVADSLEVKRRYFAEHSADVRRAAEMIAGCFASGGKLLLCGNGGSSCDAQHIAGEFINRFLPQDRRALPAIALSTDGGVLTCIANDTGFENIFARQIEALGTTGDVCVVISTSGKSPNIHRAIEQAHVQKMKVIGLLGRDGGSCAVLCDLALIVSDQDTQRIQETHNLIGHVICELVELALFQTEQTAKER
ncbi:MAG: D-sedoheptulose 7-phosphate isomerase [Acidobacteriota bacterium]|jgi:D-sedoheptulose 7-phosphate isomerase|nr:D-sedoheptulose 7-phosphate isomerase [Acidobacteriota bacterium]